ncbi:Hypothetical predicted protein [Paramuricea clavata]|uniref:Uncharacterized protein n=1 Tax=Paramuricea clavata TaxID=317549 RepID=A0A7D9HP61_PARCT|nr:Hypothetical predicted protein [Paramuricea clavata]
MLITRLEKDLRDQVFSQSDKEMIEDPRISGTAGASRQNQKNDDFDSKELTKLFLRSDKELYKGIEIIIHFICVSAVKVSVQSVIESLTSKFEIHFNKFRNVNEDTAYNEMMVGVNGPLPLQCDKVVMAAMKQHFKGQHGIRFIRSRMTSAYLTQWVYLTILRL